MPVTLNCIPRKLVDGSHSALEGVPYPELVTVVERMQTQDPRTVFDSLRPMADELWNFIDGHRTVGEIVEAVCLEFDFDLDPALFIPLIEGMEKIGIMGLSTAHTA